MGAIGAFLAVAAVLVALRIAPASAGISTHPDPTVQAHAFGMPDQGWAPLTVSFSPYGSADPDGSIVRYEWDLDGNGSFETDATDGGGYATYSYAKAGTYTVGVRVTGEDGGTAVAHVDVEVLHPASSSVDYWTVFDDSRVRRIDVIVSQSDWDLMWSDPPSKTRVPADVIVFGQRIDDVAISFKGNKLGDPAEKKSLKIDTNYYVAGQEYMNLKQILLHDNLTDPSMLRDKLGYEMMAFAGRPASHVTWARVYIDIADDGQPPAYWGVYSMVERVDRKFLANRYTREDAHGNLYKADAWFEEGGADLAYYGPDIADYPHPRGELAYGLRTNLEDSDYQRIIALTYAIDGTEYSSEDEFTTALEQIFDVDAYLRWLAVNITALNLDTFPFTANNYYLYDNPATGRFEFLPWDMNSAWGLFGGEATFDPFREVAGVGPVEYAPLYPAVFAVEEYRLAFLAYVDLLVRYWFTAGNIEGLAAEYQAVIRPHLTESTGDKAFDHGLTLESFDASARDLVSLTGERAEYLRTLVGGAG